MSRFWWSVVRAFSWVVVRLYYRRFDVAGRRNIPADGPLLVVVNHPNSLFDAAAVFLAMTRPVVVGAKEPLFRSLLWGPVLRRVGAIPVHRRQDAGADPARNRETYAAYVRALHDDRACAIFPEGFSHLEPALQFVKAGAARIAVQAEEERGDGPPVAIVPVGLIFRPAQAFRGDAHVRIGEPIGISDLAGRPWEESIPAIQERIRTALVRLMVHLDRVDLRPLVEDLARIWDHARRGGAELPGNASRADIERLAGRCMNHFLATDPAVVDEVRERHARFRRHADELGVGVDTLGFRDRPFSWTLEFVWLLVELIVGFPLFVAGMLFAYVPARITDHVSRRVCERIGVAALPVVRVVAGAVAFALFWGPLTYLFHDWAADLRVTACFVVFMSLTSLALVGYRRRLRVWSRRFFAVAPGFLRRPALARAVAARDRLLWFLQECVVRYEAETGDTILPTAEARLREAERRQQSSLRARRTVFVLSSVAAALLLFAPVQPEGLSLAATPSPWKDVPGTRAGEQLEADAGALVGHLDTLRAVEDRSDELRADFREGRRDYYTPADGNAVRDCLGQFLTCREGLLRLAWYYGEERPDRPEEQRVQAFVIAHTAIVELCSRGMQLVETFGGDADAIRRLNEADPLRGIPEGLYDDVRAELADPARLDALASGVRRFDALAAAGALPEGGPWGRIVRRARRGAEVVHELGGRVAGYDLGARIDRLVDTGDESRYAISSVVSTWIGDARIRQRPDRPGLISPQQVSALREQLRPGDILLERRNWYVSNAFLPGFWPHSALYVGGVDGLRELGIEDDPRVRPHLRELRQPDHEAHRLACIEAISDGVVFTSLEHSVGEADAVCVLRPNLPPERVAECVARALSHRGKPYDFDFDFFSTDKLVCTELVYQAFGDDLDIETVEIMGRRTLPALEYVRMWAEDRGKPDPRLTLVAFLDHDEEHGRAVPADGDTLVETLDRPGLTLLGGESGRPRILSAPVLVLIGLALVAVGLPRRRIAAGEAGGAGDGPVG